MLAGKSNYKVNTKIRIKGMKGEDRFLNGLTGTLTHPFGAFTTGDVGVYLDNTTTVNMGICNLKIGEFEEVKE